MNQPAYNNEFTTGLQLNLITASFEGVTAMKKRIPALYALYVAIAISGKLLEDAFQHSGLMPQGGHADPSILALAVVSIVTFAWSLFTTSLGLTLVARSLFTPPRLLSKLRTVELMVIETIRAVGATLRRLPLLILPGLYEWIRLAPIPFLILFDESYQRGEKDALKTARLYFSRHRARVLILLFISFALFLAEFALTQTSEDTPALWEAPLQHAGSILIFAFVRLAFDGVSLQVYRRTFSAVDPTPRNNVE